MSTFKQLLAGHADEQHEAFQHLQACCLSVDDAAQVASLLEAIGGGQKQVLESTETGLGVSETASMVAPPAQLQDVAASLTRGCQNFDHSTGDGSSKTCGSKDPSDREETSGSRCTGGFESGH